MSKQIEAMKQAIIEEASIQMTGHPSKDARWFAKSVYEYLMAEQQAPAPEPVAWLDGPHLVMRSDWRDRANYKGPWVDFGRAIPDSWIPALYTTPPAPAQPLTDEAFYRLVRIMGTFDLATGHADSWDELLDSLESELRDVLGHLRTRRKWVGLTDEEVNNYVQAVWPRNATPVAYTRTIEAKLKEKNT